MLPPILEPDSHISTGIRCKNCGISIIRVSWKQCIICKNFNLCEECGKYPYDKLELFARESHLKLHQNINNNNPINSECMQSVLITNVSTSIKSLTEKFSSIMAENKIQNDNDLCVILSKLKQMKHQLLTESDQQIKQQLCSMIVDYHVRAYDRKIRVLSLDGGGIRGYMPIKVVQQLITEKYLSNIPSFDPQNIEHRKRFNQGQSYFTKQFDYFAGTSTGGLIAFCLAVGYDILDMKDIYSRASYYFNRNYFGPLLWAKYNPSRIHDKIDEIIGTIVLKTGKQLTAKNATLLDIHNFLNPTAAISDDILKSTLVSHGNLLEYIDDDDTPKIMDDDSKTHRVKREKVLLITAYNATKDMISVFNTSYAKHWRYRIADVLKATMAAPTYFPPQALSTGIIENGHFISDKSSEEIFVDGGVFANDPELTALWAIRMQWKKFVNYHILSIGTGQYNTPISSSNTGGYFGWLVNNGLLVNMLMDATRSLTEVITSNLAKFDNMKRMKFNYKLKEAMSLDDANFVKIFDEEWESLKHGDDFKTLVYFYNNYIVEEYN